VPDDRLNVSTCPKAAGADIKTIKAAARPLLMKALFNGSISKY
jgi:hypothetical protein